MLERRKKIICTVTNGLSYDQRMHRICSALNEVGFEVELVGRVLGDFNAEDFPNFKTTRIACRFQSGIAFYVEFTCKLFMYLMRQSFDLLYAVDVDTLLACGAAASIKNKDFIYDAHEYFTEVPELTQRPFHQYIWSGIASVFIERAKAAITVGPALSALFQEKYGIPFMCIRNVPMASKQKQALKPISAKPIILYQGVLNMGRGLEAAIEAMQWVDAELWIAGEGDLSNYLREYTKQLKLESKVRFWGYVKPADLKELTLQADIGLNLLENRGLNYYYSLANKFFDYMHAGKPVICADFPEYQAIVQHYKTAILCPAEAKQIQYCIEQCIQHPEWFLEMQQQAQLASEKYHWELESEKLKNYFKKMFNHN